MKTHYSFRSIVNLGLIGIVLIALFARFFRITSNDLVFYDEGMYLGYNRAFLNLVSQNPPKNITEFLIILNLIFKTALATPKALWFFLINLRVFITGVDSLCFSRILSALCGIATVVLTFFWAKKYFVSTRIAMISAIILALLPSHVFYSRLGMQESLSCLLFLIALYSYVFSKRGFSIGSMVSAILMFAVFLTNYRMIVAPFFILLFAIFWMIVSQQRFDLRKFLLFIGLYILCFVILGQIEGGINLKVNLAWMLNQADESGQYRQWYNFLSFPYYLFKLENVFFGILFFSSFYCCYQKKLRILLPFFIVLLQILLFSFAAEKGARYLCVVLPFACMAVAAMLEELYIISSKAATGIFLGMIFGFCFMLIGLVFSSTSYEKAVLFIKKYDPQAKMISTQPGVENLFVDNETDVIALPKTIEEVLLLVKKGHRYLIIDPQLYISWTKDDKRFSQVELDFIKRLRTQAPLRLVLPHFNNAILERFVLDHNQDLLRSIHFLAASQGKGCIYIYDLGV